MGTRFKGTQAQIQALNAYIKLIRAANSVAERAQQHLAGTGITPSQFGVLEALLHLGPMSVSCLAEKHLKSPNNFTTVIDNLERKGYVRRERDVEDRRVVLVHLTDEGERRIASIFPDHVDAIVEAMSALAPCDLTQLEHLCRKLGKGVEESAE